MIKKKIDLRPALSDFDKLRKGFVSKNQFRSGLATVGIALTEVEFHILEKAFSVYKNACGMDYERFLHKVSGK